MDDTLYKAFLLEMEALEKFRMGYTALHPAAPLGREDQDVRRLTEALALFTARTRLAGQRAISRSTMRLFQQHFPYVLSPMPAMGMLRAVTGKHFVDASELPRGTQVRLSSPSAPWRP
jgi:type VI secretion system protein ImpG